MLRRFTMRAGYGGRPVVSVARLRRVVILTGHSHISALMAWYDRRRSALSDRMQYQRLKLSDHARLHGVELRVSRRRVIAHRFLDGVNPCFDRVKLPGDRLERGFTAAVTRCARHVVFALRLGIITDPVIVRPAA
jgi:hypothetical protein